LPGTQVTDHKCRGIQAAKLGGRPVCDQMITEYVEVLRRVQVDEALLRRFRERLAPLPRGARGSGLKTESPGGRSPSGAVSRVQERAPDGACQVKKNDTSEHRPALALFGPCVVGIQRALRSVFRPLLEHAVLLFGRQLQLLRAERLERNAHALALQRGHSLVEGNGAATNDPGNRRMHGVSMRSRGNACNLAITLPVIRGASTGTEIGCQTFCATGITAHRENGGMPEHAQEIAAHHEALRRHQPPGQPRRDRVNCDLLSRNAELRLPSWLPRRHLLAMTALASWTRPGKN
jgi:hypothetical protein